MVPKTLTHKTHRKKMNKRNIFSIFITQDISIVNILAIHSAFLRTGDNIVPSQALF